MILGRFADAHAHSLADADLTAFERLLDVPDQLVYEWITYAAQPPQEHDTPLLACLRAFRLRMNDTPAS